jgi:hypothetical protein
MPRTTLILMSVFLLRHPIYVRGSEFTITVYSEQGILCELAMQESAALLCPRLCMVPGLVEAYCNVGDRCHVIFGLLSCTY